MVDKSEQPYSSQAKLACGLIENCFIQSLEYSSKFHGLGSNISLTPSVHNGITISVQDWKGHPTASNCGVESFKDKHFVSFV